MTRFDKLKTMDIKDVATELCVAISDHIEDCDQCPFTDRCGLGHNGVLDWLNEEVKEAPSVSVAKKVGYKDLWNKLYKYLNDMSFGIAPDETTPTDERADRMAQLDILDGILKWMNTEEVARMREVGEQDG